MSSQGLKWGALRTEHIRQSPCTRAGCRWTSAARLSRENKGPGLWGRYFWGKPTSCVMNWMRALTGRDESSYDFSAGQLRPHPNPQAYQGRFPNKGSFSSATLLRDGSPHIPGLHLSPPPPQPQALRGREADREGVRLSFWQEDIQRELFPRIVTASC